MSHMRQDSRTQILQAALDILARDPSASMADIAAHAGVGRATLHRYFATRDDLMSALTRFTLDEIDTAIDAATEHAASYLDGLRLAMAAMIPLANHQQFLDQPNPPADIAQAYDQSMQELCDSIDAARSEGSLVTTLPTPWIAEVFEGLTYAAWTLVRREEATPKQAEAFAWTTFINGITGPNT